MSSKLNEALSTRENNFDFIRFIAAVAVIFSHSFDLTSNSAEEPLRTFSHGDTSIGELAVTIFFLISGFLITQSYNRTGNLQEYFVSRTLRIYPALIAVTLFTVFIIGPLVTRLELSKYFFDIKTIKYLFNASALKISFHLPGVFDNNPFPRDAVNGSLWSLPCELLCYILVAVVGEAVRRNFLKVVALTLLALFFIAFMRWETVFTYGFYFLCGSMFYLYRGHIELKLPYFIIILLVLFSNLGYNSILSLQVFITGICLGYSVIFLAAIKNNTFVHFARYGDFSYGLYLWAFPVQQIIAFNYSNLGNYYNFIVSAMITLIIAYFSWHFIEKPALTLKKYSINKLGLIYVKYK